MLRRGSRTTALCAQPRSVRPAFLIAVAAIVFVATSCIRADVDARVSRTGMVRATLLFAYSNDMLQFIKRDRATILKEVEAAAAASNRPGVQIEPYDDGLYVGERIVIDSIPAAEFGPTMASIVRSAGPIAAPVGQDLKLERLNNQWRFFGTIDLSKERFTIEASDGADPDLPKKTFRMNIKITFPGVIVARDRQGRARGKSITWTPQLGDVVQMQAVAKTR